MEHCQTIFYLCDFRKWKDEKKNISYIEYTILYNCSSCPKRIYVIYTPDFVSLVFINDKNKLMIFETDNILQDKPQSSKLRFYFVIDAERFKKKIARRIYRADGTSGSWSSRVKRVNSLLHTRSRVRKKNAAMRGGGAARRRAAAPPILQQIYFHGVQKQKTRRAG